MPRSPFNAVSTAGAVKDAVAKHARVVDWALQVGMLLFDFLQLGGFAFLDPGDWDQEGETSSFASGLQDFGLGAIYPSCFVQLGVSTFSILVFFLIIITSDRLEMLQLMEVPSS